MRLLLTLLTLLWLATVSTTPAWAAAQGAALITILEGSAQVIRGTDTAPATPGMVLVRGDIVNTSADNGLVRIEFADQVMLDLGPGTRVLLRPPVKPANGVGEAHAYLLTGFAKLTAAGQSASTALDTGSVNSARVLTPHIEIITGKVCLLEVQANATERRTQVFAETGESRALPRPGGRAADTAAPVLKTGQWLSAAAGSAPRVSEQPTSLWLQSVPPALRDSLGARAARFAALRQTFKKETEVSYADVGMWLQAEPALRAALLPRWKARSRNAAFRAAVVDSMRLHPEWDRVLFPEKYRSKPCKGGGSKCRKPAVQMSLRNASSTLAASSGVIRPWSFA